MDRQLREIVRQLNRIERKIDALILGEILIMANLDDLTIKVQATTDAEDSAIVLLNGLSDLLKASANDPVAIKALADKLSAGSDKLAAAVVANTPAASP